jgi:hypothetical protein
MKRRVVPQGDAHRLVGAEAVPKVDALRDRGIMALCGADRP